MPEVTISLDTSADPPVSVDNPTLEVSSGLHTITWVPAAGQTFTFPSDGALTGLPSPPFTTHVEENSITASDNNGPGYQNYYVYTLTVLYGGQQYSTEAKITLQNATPYIHNR